MFLIIDWKERKNKVVRNGTGKRLKAADPTMKSTPPLFRARRILIKVSEGDELRNEDLMPSRGQ